MLFNNNSNGRESLFKQRFGHMLADDEDDEDDRNYERRGKERDLGQIKTAQPPPDNIPYYPDNQTPQETFNFGAQIPLVIQSNRHKATAILIDIDQDSKHPDTVVTRVITTGTGMFNKKASIKAEPDGLKIKGLFGSTEVYIRISFPRELLATHPGIEIKTQNTDVRVYSPLSEWLPNFKFNFKFGHAIISNMNCRNIIGDTTNVRLWAINVRSGDGIQFSGAMLSNVRCHTLNVSNWRATTNGNVVFGSSIDIAANKCDVKLRAAPKDPEQSFVIKAVSIDGSVNLIYDAYYRGFFKAIGMRSKASCYFPHNNVISNPPQKLKDLLLLRKYSYGEHADDQLILVKVFRQQKGSV
ncbi:hypothetical protein H4219_004551 [Mycoemilia scoparia]|uniref:Uncharacterized protein n=1 Tax=Mycoemilia scoparia TaxID=417184 RepID=A0A9W8DQZ2_9FUNG|nr:hypothetical protein H4219_004551 [Mycoemilia scoparia]